MNRELLARVRDRIAEVGNEHCDMGCWSSGTMVGEGEPKCGTTACIAGHALAIGLGQFASYKYTKRPWVEAQALLGLPSSNLFFEVLWPTHYKTLAHEEGDAKGMLAVCDALLDGALVFDADGSLVEARESVVGEAHTPT